MKLQEKELTEIVNIVEKYSSLQDEFSEIEKQMQEIKDKKDDLLIRLEKVRELETSLMSDLEKSYGKGKINLNTYEYNIIEKLNMLIV